MSVRRIELRCQEPGCATRVVGAVLTDGTWVWEMRFDPSLTNPTVLQNGMGVGGFFAHDVEHRVNNGRVEHSLTRQQG